MATSDGGDSDLPKKVCTIINCVAIYYENGASRNTFLRKEKFHAQLLSNISNTRDNVSMGYPNTKKRVENVTRSEVFLMKFEVFGKPMKHCLECLIIIFSTETKTKE